MTTLTTQTRQALVTIENQTGENLVSVRVAHKYSSTKLRHALSWALSPGSAALTDFAPQPVQYHVGIATTGRDWWLALWCDAKNDYYVSAPENARDALDFGEFITGKVADAMVGVGVGALIGSPEGISKGAGLAIALTGVLISALTNSEGTVGFKQHILTNADANKTCTIVLQKNAVLFRSPSGTSVTGVRKLDSGQVAALLKKLGG